ncbi:nuclear transport factor 2 family protein [Nocardia fusca]|uniref:nuclear transport factor 2 family protein n=1 Tax=Nocardia fusca TaxID=941183 RepID=UPI0007A73020|nr:nuclear transport factor 2 family protein [Nocardia fusca]
MTVDIFDQSELAAEYGAAWNAHDLRAIMALHTADSTFRLQLLDAPLAVGHDQVRGAFAGLLSTWPDIHFDTETRQYGPGFLAQRYRATATLAAPLTLGRLTVEPNDTPVSFAGLDIITFRTGLVHTKETYLDIAEIMARLGAL